MGRTGCDTSSTSASGPLVFGDDVGRAVGRSAVGIQDTECAPGKVLRQPGLRGLDDVADRRGVLVARDADDDVGLADVAEAREHLGPQDVGLALMRRLGQDRARPRLGPPRQRRAGHVTASAQPAGPQAAGHRAPSGTLRSIRPAAPSECRCGR